MTPTRHSDQDEFRHRVEYRADETPVEAIVTAVADVTGESPVEMAPLGEVVDNDALNALVAGRDDQSAAAAVTFDYCGQRVTVTPTKVRIASSNVSD